MRISKESGQSSMKYDIKFYHWGYICPISGEMIELLKKYQHKFDITIVDITNNEEVAKNKGMYYPFLTIVNHKYRFYSPLSEAFFKTLLKGDIPVEKPYHLKLSNIEKSVTISPITSDNYFLASKCTFRTCCKKADCKIKMYQEFGLDVFGFINHEEDRLLGGAEFYPSLFVPYDIPKGQDIAFITCVYLSDEIYDYKSSPLKALENYLSKKYKKVIVISNETGLFPNGDLDFFKQHGYIDEQIVFEDEYCKLHLLSKIL